MRLENKEKFITKSLESCKYLGSEVIYYDRTDSTMEDARKLIEQQAADGSVIIAEQQTAGKGRYNRKWYSPLGGIYLSLILFREIEMQKQGLLSLTAGVASCETIKKYLPEAEIKWPNDVLFKEKKISGILIEKLGNYYSIGTGINTNTEKFEGEFLLQPTSIYLETEKEIDNNNFIINFLKKFDENYDLLANHEYNAILEKWKSMSLTIGRKVKLRNPMIKGEREIDIINIDNNGFLIAETEKGIEKIISGEIFY